MIKNNLKSVVLLGVLFLVLACGPSIKLIDAWTADNIEKIEDETLLVMVRTDSRSSRQILENNIAEKLRDEGIDAVESYTKYPSLKMNQKVTEEEINEFVKVIMKDGFEGVVLTVLRDVTSELVTEQSGGYYTGGGYPSRYGGYYGGFGGYYGNAYSPYGMGGSYVPATERTYTQDIYKLETVVYDLRKDSNAQLIAVIGVDITDPDSTSQIAEGYAKKVVEGLKK